MVGNCHCQPVALKRPRNQAARIIFVFFETFLIKKTLLFGDEDRDLMADVIIAVGNQNGLI
jgi:hypothetical protein